jgi:hypothetical protein
MRYSLLALVASCTLLAQVSEKTPGWFPFPMSPVDSFAGTAVDASFLDTGPADSRISVKGPHFVNAAGKRVRFIGTNVTFSNAFPEKADATRIADRMAQLGFNVVRFHHMDARDIWLPGQTALDPAKLDRLDWFIAELKRNGIYSNINLHVSRTYPGLKKMTSERSFRYGKIVDKFHDPYIELQLKYAHDLLGHVNPYTKTKLGQEPSVAFVELNNENTLLNLRPSVLALLPDPLKQSLADKWSAWLLLKYPSLAALKKAWTGDLIPLGKEMLTNPDFAQGTDGWNVEGLKKGECDVKVVKAANGKPALRVDIAKKGKVSWAYQVHQLDLKFQEGMTYTMHFRGRAKPARRVFVSLRFAEPPWTNLSRSTSVQLTPEWQDFTIVTPVSGVRPELKQRFSINLGDEVGEVELADASLRTGCPPFEPGDDVKSIADLPLPVELWPGQAWADFRRFLIDTECDYVKRLRTYLRDDLQVKSLIVDTQASYGNYWGLHREATLNDYIDMHAYWQHPHFPGKPWDGNNWNIPNTSMVAAQPGRSTFERLAAYRLAGKPFSVSEYNHPAPNDHAAELFPMLVSFASVQDWDALYQFCYGNNIRIFKDPKLSGYFTLGSHSGQLVFAPLASIIFRQGLISPEELSSTLELPEPYLDSTLADGYLSPTKLVGGDVFTREQEIGSRFSVSFPKKGDKPKLIGGIGEPSMEFTWTRDGDRPNLQVAAPAARIAVGEIGGQSVQLGDLSITARPPDGTWAAFAVAATDGRPLGESKKALLALVTRVENTNMGWNEDRTTVGRKWGSAPLVAQGVPAELILPGKTKPRVTALDSLGKPTASVPVTGVAGAWRVNLGPKFKTLWYVIER